MAPVFIGVDIGGTKIASGLVNHSGEVLFRARVPMVVNGTAADGFDAVRIAIDSVSIRLGPGDEVAAIGVCSPGPLDPQSGVVINPPNLPCWQNFALGKEVARAYRVPAFIDNDGNAAALAEAKWGAGKGYRNVFYACIGTGIGTGIIFDGQIYHGRTGAAAEGGHVTIDYRGPICACGKHGCIEALASGPAIAERARQTLSRSPSPSLLLELASGKAEAITSEIVAQAYAGGDPAAASVLSETVDLLSWWLGNIIDLLEPDVIIVGGGVASMLEPFFGELRSRVAERCINPTPANLPLVKAHYGEDAGIAGAAALCMAVVEENRDAKGLMQLHRGSFLSPEGQP
jgi:glucokinase